MLGQKVFQKTTEVKEGKIKNKKICRIVQIQTKKLYKIQFNSTFFIFFYLAQSKEKLFLQKSIFGRLSFEF